MVNFHQVKIFSSVAKHLSETKAAQELHLSQSALSRHLTALQDQFGALFNKNGRGLELTARGAEFYSEIQPILARINALDQKYGAKIETQIPKQVLVGSSYGPATSVLPSVAAAFKVSIPR